MSLLKAIILLLFCCFLSPQLFAQTEKENNICLKKETSNLEKELEQALQTTNESDSLPQTTSKIDERKTRLSDLTEGLKKVYKISTGQLIKVGKKLNDIDTLYISPNRYNLAFMLEQSTWFEHYKLGGGSGESNQSISFAPNANAKLGVYFGWRWIFLGLSFDIKDILGQKKSPNEKKRKEFILYLYSGKFGIDLYSKQTGSNFKISSYSNFDLKNDYVNTDFEGFESKIRGINAYWIFNHRKFSFPAAFSQSTNQRRSCGSLMAGFSYSKHNITFNRALLPQEMQAQIKAPLQFNKLKYTDYNLSLGYGYNWVFARNCLLNISLLPAIGFKKARVDDQPTNNDTSWTRWIKDVNFDLITRAGLTWNNGKYYVGASLILHTYDYRKENFSMTNSFGSLRIYMGLNFWKKKEYR